MRKIGKINWFGGHNRNTHAINDYGYIKCEDNADLFVHKKNILCSEDSLKSDVWVTFEVGISYGKYTAFKVKLLRDEEDMSLISECVNNENLDICTAVLLKYLKSIHLDEGIDFILEKLKAYKGYQKYKIEKVLEELPNEYFYSSKEFRKHLNKNRCLEILMHLWRKEHSDEIKNEILILVEEKFKYEVYIYRRLFDEFYKKDAKAINNIPNEIYVKLLIELIDDSKIKDKELLVDELKRILVEKDLSDNTWNEIPNNILIEFYKKDIKAIKNIPDTIYITLLLELIGDYEIKDKELLVGELKRILVEKEANDIIWDEVPNSILIKADLVNNVSLSRQIDVATDEYNEKNNIDKLNIIEQKLRQLPYDEREKKLELMNDEIKVKENIFCLLNPIQEVNVASKIGNISWNALSNKAKVLFVYKMAKENTDLSVLNGIQEQNDLVRSILNVLWAKYYADEIQKKSIFLELHKSIQNAVLFLSKDSEKKIDLWPILPKCDLLPIIEYCEGRPWPTEEDKLHGCENASRIYCPRKKGVCTHIHCVNGHTYGNSRVYSNRHLSWNNWTLLELMQECNIAPDLIEIIKNRRYVINNKEYVCKLAGWINRLNEIRERLKCKKCKKSMINNFAYAKYLAVYSSTIVFCDELEYGHDKNIYLSHCWNCHEIIDSRDGAIREEGFYLCVHCGNGPQNSKNYYPGKRCPKCGSYNMNYNYDYDGFANDIYTCNDCGHSITVK